ncbi:MAG: hypothetical protein FWD18_10080 [Micrococcales bacterium]|nr:hypothetical protein [Micrococcales bacterium]
MPRQGEVPSGGLHGPADGTSSTKSSGDSSEDAGQGDVAREGAGVTDVLAFLAAAPPEVRRWLVEQAEGETGRSAEGSSEAASDERAPEPASEAPAPEEAEGTETEGPEKAEEAEKGACSATVGGFDEPDDEDDDILYRPRGRASRGQPRGAQPARGGSRVSRGLLLLAVVVGVVLGVWIAGLGDAPSTVGTGESPPLSAGTGTGTEVAARVAALEARLKTDPQDTDALLELGVLEFNFGDIEVARGHWEVALEIDPTQAQAWYNLGFYHLTTDPADTDAARAAWGKVLEIDPDSPMAATVRTHLDGISIPGAGAGGEGPGDEGSGG